MQNLLTEFKNAPNKTLVFLLALTLFLSPLLYFEPLLNPSELPRYVLIAIAALIAPLVLITGLWTQKYSLAWHPINIPIILFATIAVLSGLWAVETGGYYLKVVPFIALLLLYFVASHCYKHTTLFFYATLIAALYAAIIGLLQNYQLDPFNYRDANTMASTFVYKNHAALYFDLVIPTSIALILIAKKGWLKWAITIASAICLSYLLETHTRGSWLALFLTSIAVSLFIFLKRKKLTPIIDSIKKSKLELLALIIITSATLYNPSPIDETWSRESYYDEKILDTSSNDRLIIYKNSLNMLMENPLGVGLGSFWKGFREYTNSPEIISRTDIGMIVYRAHSDPLQYFLELGLIGGAFALLIFFYLMYTAVTTILNIKNTQHKILCLGIGAALLTSAFHSLVDFPFQKPSSALQFWVLAGLLVGFSTRDLKPENKLSRNTEKKIIIVFSVIVLSLGFFASRLYIPFVPSNFHHNNAINVIDTDCNTALSEIEKSLALSPYFYRAHHTRVDTYFKCVDDNKLILPVLNEELEFDDSYEKALIRRGYLYLETKQFAAAFNDFKRVDQLLPHRYHGHFGAVQVLLTMGNIEQGMVELKKIIKKHPDFMDAKNQLQKIERLIKNKRIIKRQQ